MGNDRTITVSLEDRLENKDRWNALMILVMMVLFAWATYSISEIQSEYDERNPIKQENPGGHPGFEHVY